MLTRVGGRIYIVATNDKDLKRRIRKIPGVPIMTCATGKYVSTDILAFVYVHLLIMLDTLSNVYPMHPRSRRWRRGSV